MEKPKILIVDDDADLTVALKAILESKGYLVDTATDRSGGMARITAAPPDLLILDVMMNSWQDGFEMSRELKGDERFKNIPILILTAVKDKTGISFKAAAGDRQWLPVEGFLDKPIEPKDLLSKVGELLGKSEADGQ